MKFFRNKWGFAFSSSSSSTIILLIHFFFVISAIILVVTSTILHITTNFYFGGFGEGGEPLDRYNVFGSLYIMHSWHGRKVYVPQVAGWFSGANQRLCQES